MTRAHASEPPWGGKTLEAGTPELPQHSLTHAYRPPGFFLMGDEL